MLTYCLMNIEIFNIKINFLINDFCYFSMEENCSKYNICTYDIILPPNKVIFSIQCTSEDKTRMIIVSFFRFLIWLTAVFVLDKYDSDDASNAYKTLKIIIIIIAYVNLFYLMMALIKPQLKPKKN